MLTQKDKRLMMAEAQAIENMNDYINRQRHVYSKRPETVVVTREKPSQLQSPQVSRDIHEFELGRRQMPNTTSQVPVYPQPALIPPNSEEPFYGSDHDDSESDELLSRFGLGTNQLFGGLGLEGTSHYRPPINVQRHIRIPRRITRPSYAVSPPIGRQTADLSNRTRLFRTAGRGDILYSDVPERYVRKLEAAPSKKLTRRQTAAILAHRARRFSVTRPPSWPGRLWF